MTTTTNGNAISATSQEMTSQEQLVRLVYEPPQTHHKAVGIKPNSLQRTQTAVYASTISQKSKPALTSWHNLNPCLFSTRHHPDGEGQGHHVRADLQRGGQEGLPAHGAVPPVRTPDEGEEREGGHQQHPHQHRGPAGPTHRHL